MSDGNDRKRVASSDCLEGIARKYRLEAFTRRYHVVRVEKNKRARRLEGAAEALTLTTDS